MTKIYAAILIAMLASCGAAGDPLRPTANVGMSVGSDGARTNASVRATNGPFTISVGM